MTQKTILLVGTYDTKQEELSFLAGAIEQAGGRVLKMDVSVLGDTEAPIDISKHDVAAAAGMTIADIVAFGDENEAMQAMARGAVKLALEARMSCRFDGVLALGGSMGTDLALDLCGALPIGVPKYVISTVAFSPMIPPARLPADIQMILWAGGLYGLSSVCKSALSQAAGAVLGACRTALPPDPDKPLIGMTSLGLSALTYGAPEAGAGGARLRGRGLSCHRHGGTGVRVAGRTGRFRRGDGFLYAGAWQPYPRLRDIGWRDKAARCRQGGRSADRRPGML